MKSEFFFCDSQLIHAHDNHVMMVQLDNPLDEPRLILPPPAILKICTQCIKKSKKVSLKVDPLFNARGVYKSVYTLRSRLNSK